jgi:hypothetical protein
VPFQLFTPNDPQLALARVRRTRRVKGIKLERL